MKSTEYPTRYDPVLLIYSDLEIEIAALLVATTILQYMVDGIWNDAPRDIAQGTLMGINDLAIAQFILYCDKKCILTTDGDDRTLVPSMAYMARPLGIAITNAAIRTGGAELTCPPSGPIARIPSSVRLVPTRKAKRPYIGDTRDIDQHPEPVGMGRIDPGSHNWAIWISTDSPQAR